MPSVEYFYYSFPHPTLGVISRPYAPIELSYNGTTVRVAFLVDSGADMSVLPYKTGKDLGLKLRHDDLFYTLGGAATGIPVVYRVLQMNIGPYQIDCRVAWALSHQAKAILGRMDVFKKFNIEFRESEDRTIFTPVTLSTTQSDGLVNDNSNK